MYVIIMSNWDWRSNEKFYLYNVLRFFMKRQARKMEEDGEENVIFHCWWHDSKIKHEEQELRQDFICLISFQLLLDELFGLQDRESFCCLWCCDDDNHDDNDDDDGCEGECNQNSSLENF
jgi:hypothetical protein